VKLGDRREWERDRSAVDGRRRIERAREVRVDGDWVEGEDSDCSKL
tara:strand:+ start:186 stop:323 length:138 start_codon:yes stop_codon:yes gene_type:complete